MPADVKICGLSTPETVTAALEAGADLVGFNFYPPSPRYVSAPKAGELAKLARGRARIVALIVDAEDSVIDEIARIVDPDFFQAQGSEGPERIAEIGKRTGKPVIKVIKVRSLDDVAQTRAYDGIAALILYDAKAPETLKGALPGGNGIAFDWKLLGQGNAARSFLLAGGLNPGNVAEAIRVTGAPIVDVSSGVEISPGIKDITLIREFIAAAKGGR
ncbi:phosphoribosylanthranilate isomerase [Taklimakanibacter lacteus]|uniref:phosphoribosylanthranilate isomerase n=1 Tax=Taklimakanibacter lacteus TaxID=2268456 RepID=UPI000E671648